MFYVSTFLQSVRGSKRYKGSDFFYMSPLTRGDYGSAAVLGSKGTSLIIPLREVHLHLLEYRERGAITCDNLRNVRRIAFLCHSCRQQGIYYTCCVSSHVRVCGASYVRVQTYFLFAPCCVDEETSFVVQNGSDETVYRVCDGRGIHSAKRLISFKAR